MCRDPDDNLDARGPLYGPDDKPLPLRRRRKSPLVPKTSTVSRKFLTAVVASALGSLIAGPILERKSPPSSDQAVDQAVVLSDDLHRVRARIVRLEGELRSCVAQREAIETQMLMEWWWEHGGNFLV